MSGNTSLVYVTPGDRINFSVVRKNRPKFIFTGDNAAHYSYVTESEEFIRTNKAYPIFNKDKGTEVYQKDVSTWRKLQLQFLTDYQAKYKVSKGFLEFANNRLDQEYIHYLFSPIYSKRFSLADAPAGYLDTADRTFVNSKNQIKYVDGVNLRAFTYKHIMFSPDGLSQNFDALYNNIMTQFKDESRAALLTNLIGVYVKRQSESNREQILRAIKFSRSIVRDTNMLKYISRREVECTKLNRQIPDSVLNTSYFKKFNAETPITMKDLLETYKGEAILIDFWASWCIPCREDIAKSGPAKELLKQAKVKLLYISLDTKANESAWKKATVKDQITEDQYILTGDFKSPLATYLQAYSIPRYVMLDKDHRIINYDAPRISPGQINQLKAAVMTKVVTFNEAPVK